MAKKTDQKTTALIAEVARRKAEIAKIDKPDWKTNCSFSFIEGTVSNSVNLHVENSVKNLICIAGFLVEKQKYYNEAALLLGITDAAAFTWQGFAVDDWMADIRARIAKIQISAKKKGLEQLESRLNAIISPELRAELELQAIANELG